MLTAYSWQQGVAVAIKLADFGVYGPCIQILEYIEKQPNVRSSIQKLILQLLASVTELELSEEMSKRLMKKLDLATHIQQENQHVRTALETLNLSVDSQMALLTQMYLQDYTIKVKSVEPNEAEISSSQQTVFIYKQDKIWFACISGARGISELPTPAALLLDDICKRPAFNNVYLITRQEIAALSSMLQKHINRELFLTEKSLQHIESAIHGQVFKCESVQAPHSVIEKCLSRLEYEYAQNILSLCNLTPYLASINAQLEVSFVSEARFINMLKSTPLPELIKFYQPNIRDDFKVALKTTINQRLLHEPLPIHEGKLTTADGSEVALPTTLQVSYGESNSPAREMCLH